MPRSGRDLAQALGDVLRCPGLHTPIGSSSLQIALVDVQDEPQPYKHTNEGGRSTAESGHTRLTTFRAKFKWYGNALRQISIIRDEVEWLLATVADVQVALDTLKADTSAALQDLAAKITALSGNTLDAATAQSLVDEINTIDSSVKGADPGPQA